VADQTQHGGGTNALIFNIQTIRIQRALSRFFDFIFLNAPFPSHAGANVLPTFDGCDPYFVWTKSVSGALPQESMNNIEAAVEGRESDVVAILGFSQGGKLGAGLLLMQQLRDKNTSYPINFKFGVMCMSVTPPLVSKDFWDRRNERILVPSLHVVGTEDEWHEESLTLFEEHFDNKNSTLLEFDIGHRLPIEDEQTMKIVNSIIGLYKKTTGKELVEFHEWN